MRLGIDHLVIAVPDPDAAAAILEAAIGLAVTGGGRHELGGTFNRLAFLGDSYLELIGVFDRALVAAADGVAVGRRRWRCSTTGREGLATYALATDDVGGEVVRLRAAGSPIGDAVPGSRRRPDGELVRWVTAFPVLGPDRPPFLIEHEPAGAEWGTGAREAAGGVPASASAARCASRRSRSPCPTRAAADRFGTRSGIEVDAGRPRSVGGQAIRSSPADAASSMPIIDLAGERGLPALDLVRFGIRWRRRAADEPASRHLTAALQDERRTPGPGCAATIRGRWLRGRRRPGEPPAAATRPPWRWASAGRPSSCRRATPTARSTAPSSRHGSPPARTAG